MMKKLTCILLLFFLILMSVNFLPGCSGGQNQKAGAEASPGAGSSDEEFFSEDAYAKEQYITDEDAPPTRSMEKIAAAQAAGKLDEENTAKLSVIAAYNPEALPEEYAGDAGDSAQFPMRYLIANWNSLTEDTRQAVEPYILPLDDPKSFFNPEYNQKGSASAPGLFPLCVANAADTDIVVKTQFTHDNQTVTIQYVEKKTWSDDIKQLLENTVQTVKGTIILSWDKFKPYMQTSLTVPLVVELMPLGGSIYGDEVTMNNYHRIRINYKYAQNTKVIKSTTAHELFHSFQDEYKIGFSGIEEKWFCEATAVWSENYALPDLNFEHTRHDGFFATLDKERINFGNCFEYHSYMLFYYLTDYAGTDFIRDLTVLNGKKGNSVIRSYLNDNIPDIANTYAEFALYNWNNKPVKEYNDFGPITGNPNVTLNIMGLSQEDSQTISLKPGACKYYHYSFESSDEELQHIRITFEGALSDNTVKRYALLLLNGEWQVEDWSDETEKIYCRVQDDNLEELVLIYSNGDFTKKDKNGIDRFVVRNEKCHEEMGITVNATFEYQTENFKWESTSTFNETVEIKDHCLFLVRDENYNFSGSGTMDGNDLIDASASFSYAHDETVLGDSMTRIILNTANNMEGVKEGYEDFSIKDNIPSSGIFITVPALPPDGGISGSSTLYFPDPIGTMTIDSPYLFDGLTQIGAIIPDIKDWTSSGFSFSREIDVIDYESPLLNMFTVDFSELQKQLELLEAMPPLPDMSDLPDMGDLGGLEGIDGLEGMDGLEGIDGMGGFGSSFSGLSELMKIMTAPKSITGAKAVLKIQVQARYAD